MVDASAARRGNEGLGDGVEREPNLGERSSATRAHRLALVHVDTWRFPSVTISREVIAPISRSGLPLPIRYAINRPPPVLLYAAGTLNRPGCRVQRVCFRVGCGEIYEFGHRPFRKCSDVIFPKLLHNLGVSRTRNIRTHTLSRSLRFICVFNFH